MSDLVVLGPGSVAAAASLMLISGGLSIWLRLGMERRLLIATTRAVVQLTLLGYVLLPVFRWVHPAAVGSILLGMVFLASREAVARLSRRYVGIRRDAFISLALSASVSGILGCGIIIQAEPWWSPRYVIPLVGMILGNGLTGIALGLDRCLTSFDEGRDKVDALLAAGATRFEAARPVVQEAVRTGMFPIINTMSVVGLIAVPGMMTGQMLGGTAPEMAARYQILILFLIASAIAMGVVLAVLFSIGALFDEDHRLRPERLQRRAR